MRTVMQRGGGCGGGVEEKHDPQAPHRSPPSFLMLSQGDKNLTAALGGFLFSPPRGEGGEGDGSCCNIYQMNTCTLVEKVKRRREWAVSATGRAFLSQIHALYFVFPRLEAAL